LPDANAIEVEVELFDASIIKGVDGIFENDFLLGGIVDAASRENAD
jgi:hypothetical protein